MMSALTALCLSMQGYAEPALIPAAPELSATNYFLIDADTGTTIVGRKAEEKTPPASLTKIMTSYVIEREIEQGRVSLKDEVPISEKAWRMGGSKMYVQEGTKVV
ncbi:MAG: serine hydrolase, partial [Pseudomonadota bacterium]